MVFRKILLLVTVIVCVFFVNINIYAQVDKDKTSIKITKYSKELPSEEIKDEYLRVKSSTKKLKNQIDSIKESLSNKKNQIVDFNILADKLIAKLKVSVIDNNVREIFKEKLKEYREKSVKLESELYILEIESELQLLSLGKQLNESLKEKESMESKYVFDIQATLELAQEQEIHMLSVMELREYPNKYWFTGKGYAKVNGGNKYMWRSSTPPQLEIEITSDSVEAKSRYNTIIKKGIPKGKTLVLIGSGQFINTSGGDLGIFKITNVSKFEIE